MIYNKQFAMRRAIDLTASMMLLPIALPICIAAMIAVRCESKGSPFFIQRRVGRQKKPFRLFKIRTMAHLSSDVPSHEINPMQITAVGAFLRRTKLDELPQLLNVLNGSMSLVGPRPSLPSQLQLISERERYGLFELLPGVTGPGQLAGLDMSDPIRLAEVEAAYFRDGTPLHDMLLIMRTALGHGSGDAATKTR